jgi:hypothetical protein
LVNTADSAQFTISRCWLADEVSPAGYATISQLPGCS